MKRLDSLLIGLLAASAVVLGVLEAAGLIRWKPVYLLCYALAVAVIFIPGRGNTGRVIRLALIFLIFAGIPTDGNSGCRSDKEWTGSLLPF